MYNLIVRRKNFSGTSYGMIVVFTVLITGAIVTLDAEKTILRWLHPALAISASVVFAIIVHKVIAHSRRHLD